MVIKIRVCDHCRNRNIEAKPYQIDFGMADGLRTNWEYRDLCSQCHEAYISMFGTGRVFFNSEAK